MQAVILRRFLPEGNGWNASPGRCRSLRELGLGEHVALPVVARSARTSTTCTSYARPTATLQRRLKDAGVASAVYYGDRCICSPCSPTSATTGSLPETEAAAREGLALPMFPTLVEAQQLEVVNAVRGAAIAAA
jgi:dTDP-4-amino-4,6-dideoxygalactose transaminase